jgi:hypothetical protein
MVLTQLNIILITHELGSFEKVLQLTEGSNGKRLESRFSDRAGRFEDHPVPERQNCLLW